MATTKTLTPTNQAITLAAFTEKPDNRTNVTNDDKLADAVNALNSKIANNDFHALTTSQTNYTLEESTHYKNGYIKRGGFCFVNVSVKCVTPGTEINIFDNLPLMTPSSMGTSVVKTIDADDYSGNTVGMLMQRGNLYLYGGTANKKYHFSFIYPVEM